MDELCILFLQSMKKAHSTYFTNKLMHWHATENNRSLPWKNERDPYKIWLSEIILQQTRAEQGLPYYQNFIKAYPTVDDLARARDEDVFRLWQGLGYYNRCRNMLFSARYIHTELNGRFPDTHEDILSLKGVGAYTAAAIASFAYDLPHAVLDGNVYRVLSRYYGIATAIDSTDGKKEFAALAQELLDTSNSAAYNQAIMDLGATVCTPKSPKCNSCPLQKKCFAYEKGIIQDLPVKSKKLKVKTRYFHYILFIHEGNIWLKKRTGNDIWQNLHEPFLVEAGKELSKKELLQHADVSYLSLQPRQVIYEGSLSQRLTHRIISSAFYTVHTETKPDFSGKGGFWLPISELGSYALPKTIVSFIEKKSYF